MCQWATETSGISHIVLQICVRVYAHSHCLWRTKGILLDSPVWYCCACIVPWSTNFMRLHVLIQANGNQIVLSHIWCDRYIVQPVTSNFFLHEWIRCDVCMHSSMLQLIPCSNTLGQWSSASAFLHNSCICCWLLLFFSSRDFLLLFYPFFAMVYCISCHTSSNTEQCNCL